MIPSNVLFASTSFLLAGALAPAALAQCCGAPKPAAAAQSPATPHTGHAAAPHAATLHAASLASPSNEPANKLCPIKQGKVDTESPTRQFKGVTIGFCCPGCEGKWDKKTNDEKMALLITNAPEVLTVIEAAAHSKSDSTAASSKPTAAAPTDDPAAKLARGYLAACGKADVKALNVLFLDKGRATVSENASDEGTWETYRDHHLLPELKGMPGFVMTVTKEDVQTFGTTSIVRQIGSFTVPDPNHKELTKKYLAAVTYVVVDEDGTPRIAHLHWSSRAEKKPDAAAPTTPDGGHGHGADHEHK